MAPSKQMQELVTVIRQVASSNFTVLIQGETGTGKELVARAIHQESMRAEHPLVAIDTASRGWRGGRETNLTARNARLTIIRKEVR